MRALIILAILIVLQVLSLRMAEAFTGHDRFQVETVKPWGEFGFRAIGKGKNITEMRFDCAKTTDMGLLVSVVNGYGRTSHLVIPSEKLGKDKFQCQERLKQYFSSVSNQRTLASIKNQKRVVELKSSKAISFY